jgi:dTDP-4-dehydrorhamnose 3,5-epimerase
MKVTATELPGVLVIEPKVFGDPRGWFCETFSAARYAEAGIAGPFVQDNVSRSGRGIVRGLHLQHPHAQGKLVSVIEGAVLDVAVDLRVGSPAFGKWVARKLTAENHEQLWIPAGLAHGFCVLGESALFAYKCTDYYHPEHEVGVVWNDPDLGIAWPVQEPVISPKDRALPRLRDLDRAKLPLFDPSSATPLPLAGGPGGRAPR